MNSNIKQADRFDTISNNQSLSGEQAKNKVGSKQWLLMSADIATHASLLLDTVERIKAKWKHKLSSHLHKNTEL